MAGGILRQQNPALTALAAEQLWVVLNVFTPKKNNFASV